MSEQRHSTVPGASKTSGASLDSALTGATTQDVGLTPFQRQQMTTSKTEYEEHPDDRKARLSKEMALFWICALVVMAALVGAVYGLIVVTNAEDKRWLQSVVTLILGGFLGYAVKR